MIVTGLVMTTVMSCATGVIGSDVYLLIRPMIGELELLPRIGSAVSAIQDIVENGLIAPLLGLIDVVMHN